MVRTSGLSLCHLQPPNDFRTLPQRVSAVYVPPVPSGLVPLLTPFHKLCEGSSTSPIGALDFNFREAVDHSEPLPKYTPLALDRSLILRAPTPASASQVIGRRLCHGSNFFAPPFSTTKDSFLCFPYRLFTSELFSLSYQPGQSGLFY